MTAVESILWLVSIAGVGGTFYFGFKFARLAREKQRFTWTDVSDGCRKLARKVVRRFKPDIMVCFSGPSAIVANLVVEYSKHFIPIYVIVIEKISESKSPRFTIPGYESILTSKWRLHIPSGLFSDTSRRILIIDDSIMSGDSLSQIRAKLADYEFDEKNIFACSLICSNVAAKSHKAPNLYCYLVQNSDFFLPWGRGY